MPGFTTRTLKATPAPEPAEIANHIDALDLKERADKLSVRLTEFVR